MLPCHDGRKYEVVGRRQALERAGMIGRDGCLSTPRNVIRQTCRTVLELIYLVLVRGTSIFADGATLAPKMSTDYRRLLLDSL